MAARQAFDENRNLPGIQAMPSIGAKPPPDPAAAFRRTLELRQKVAQLSAYDEAGTGMSRTIQRSQLRIAQQQLMDAERSLTRINAQGVVKAAPAAVTAPTPSPAAVSTPTAPASAVDALPAAPVAATNPASEISPEEQQARLRARMLLMSYTQRGGRGGLNPGASLGVRSLAGF